MKKILALALLLLGTQTFAQSANDVLGLWKTDDGKAYVRIYEKGGKYFGKITWLRDPYDNNGKPKTDDNGDEILDMEIMKNFVFDDEEWADGTIYDAESGKTYHGSMELDGDNKLDLRGSIDSFGLLGRTETWTRMNEKADR